jgi:hypothetical protein
MQPYFELKEPPSREVALNLLRSGPLGLSAWSRMWTPYVESRKPLNGRTLYNLDGANLSGICLADVDLSFVDLSGADMGSSVIKRSDFFGSDLSGVRFDKVVALQTDFRAVKAKDLSGAKAVFTKCDLTSGTFTRSSMPNSILIGCELTEVNFSAADLRKAAIHHSVLIGTDFADACLDEVSLWNAHFVDVDITPFTSVHATHAGPSPVDWRSVLKSVKSPGLLEFLVSTGMPEVFASSLIAAARSITDGQKRKFLRTTFISFGAPDEAFARRLYDALTRNGVVTFFFPESAQPGLKLSSLMSTGINEYDRTILICSQASLVRPGVRNEIQLAVDREAREGGSSRIIPVTIDDFVFTEWWPERPENSRAIRDRVIADFREADKFPKEVSKLLIALRCFDADPGD